MLVVWSLVVVGFSPLDKPSWRLPSFLFVCSHSAQVPTGVGWSFPSLPLLVFLLFVGGIQQHWTAKANESEQKRATAQQLNRRLFLPVLVPEKE